MSVKKSDKDDLFFLRLAEDVLLQLKTNIISGLSANEVLTRGMKYGCNFLDEHKEKSLFSIFISKF